MFSELKKNFKKITNTNNSYNTVNIQKEEFKTDKNELPKLNILCINLLKKNMSFLFIFNMLINILLCSFLIPLLIKLSNEYFINTEKIMIGIKIVISSIIIENISIIHKIQYIEFYKRKFGANNHFDIEEIINSSMLKINFNKLRELNSDELERKKNQFKWSILTYIASFIHTFISMFSFFGYIFWIGCISPFSLLLYIVFLGLFTILFPHKAKNKDKYSDIWKEYSFLKNGFFTDIVHHLGRKTLDKMKKLMSDLEEHRDEEHYNHSIFTNSITLIFNFVFIINCVIISYNISDSTIINYIQFSFLTRNSVSSCINLYNLYNDCEKEYSRLIDIIEDKFVRKEVKQNLDYKGFTINQLNYEYPSKHQNDIPFRLTLTFTLKFKSGEIILLDGSSGHGKSTFVDIVNGIIPDDEYDSDIIIFCPTTQFPINGFDCLTKTRYYVEQHEKSDWKQSIYKLVSGLNNFDSTVEENVWTALVIACCLDFVKRDNDVNDLKYIYSDKVGLSGGQKARIAIARSMYRVIVNKPKILTLDEVDKAIQSELVCEIMKNIFKYTQDNNILLFVICHNRDVKELKYYNDVLHKEFSYYSKKLNFTNGVITQIQ